MMGYKACIEMWDALSVRVGADSTIAGKIYYDLLLCGGDVFLLIYFLECDSISLDGRYDEITGESVPCDFKVNKRKA